MKRGMRKTAAACCIALLLLSGCGKTAGNVNSDTADSSAVTEQSDSEESAASQSDTDDIDSMFTDRDKEAGYDEEKCVAITLSDDGSSCDNTSVAIDGQTITITEEGTYLLSGSLSNGSVVVATDENVKVRLIFNGVAINNDSSAAIYVQSADKVFITLAPDSENMLSNGGTYEAVDDNNIDSVIFSKSDLTLNGSGSLTVTAKAGHGIVSKDDLVIIGGTYAITAASQGLSGKDSIRILDGDFAIASGKDALYSENEDNAEKGFVYIAGGNFNLTASGDGISASGNMTLLDGMYTMTTGGGSENGKDHQEGGPGGSGGPGGMDNPGEDMVTSGERPKENRGEMSDNDQMTPPSDNSQNGTSSDNSESADNRPTAPSDDQQPSGQMMEQPDRSDEETETEETTSTKGIKAKGNLIISGGTYTINAADDGIHSNSNITINDGTLAIASGDDGVHADGQVIVNDGTIAISESYEGIEGNEKILIVGGQITLTSSDDGFNGDTIEISGGHTEIDAEGDGIDANGILTVSGGETYVSGPTGDGNGALDYETDAVITGGILVAAGSSGMAVNFGNNSTQGSVLVNMDRQEAGTDIVLTDALGTELINWQASKKYTSVVISCPGIAQGESYTLKAGTSKTTVTMDSLIYGTGNTMGR